MSGWLISIQKPSTGATKVVVVAVPDQAAALHAVERALAGLRANLSTLRPLDAGMLQTHGVPPGGIKLI